MASVELSGFALVEGWSQVESKLGGNGGKAEVYAEFSPTPLKAHRVQVSYPLPLLVLLWLENEFELLFVLGLDWVVVRAAVVKATQPKIENYNK